MTEGRYYHVEEDSEGSSSFSGYCGGNGKRSGIFGASFEETLREVQNGNATAQNSLGFMYHNGEGVKQDKSEAVNWLRKAARQGYPNAQEALKILGETW